MKNLYFSISIFVILLFVALPAYALSSYGSINGTYDYKNFTCTNENGRIYISGTIVNRTNKVQEGAWVTIYGLDYFEKVLWKETIYISVIDKYGKYDFSTRVSPNKEPSKISIKASE